MSLTAPSMISPDWALLKWIRWVSLYLLFGVFCPWFMTRAWAHQHGKDVRPRPRQLFKNGELGLAALVLAISVIWDIQKSEFMPHTIALASTLLAFAALMAAWVWIESYCRQTTGTPASPDRTWHDSRTLAFLVFTMAGVTEILLDRFAKVVTR